MNKLEIAKEFAKSLDEPEIKKIILFGSVARGEDKKNSDIDLLVIGKGDRFRLRWKLLDKVLDYLDRYKVYISLKVLSTREYKELGDTYFISKIKKEGVLIG